MGHSLLHEELVATLAIDLYSHFPSGEEMSGVTHKSWGDAELVQLVDEAISLDLVERFLIVVECGDQVMVASICVELVGGLLDEL